MIAASRCSYWDTEEMNVVKTLAVQRPVACGLQRISNSFVYC